MCRLVHTVGCSFMAAVIGIIWGGTVLFSRLEVVLFSTVYTALIIVCSMNIIIATPDCPGRNS
jgi:hypothetical protein